MEDYPTSSLLEKAKQAYKNDQYSECVRFCEIALSRDTESKADQIQIMHLLADVLLDLEQFPKAVDLYSKLLALETSDIAFANRGYAFFEMKQWNLALHDYLEAIRINPANMIATGFVAECHLKSGNPETAISFLLQAIKSKPTWGRLHRILGHAYSSKGEWSDAYSAFRNAVDLDPADEVSKRAFLEIEKSADDA